MLLQPPSAPDFGDPLGLLSACHQRMQGFCELLARIDAHLRDHPVDTDVLSSAQRVQHYFNTAAPLHHADEEQDLFPLLSGDPTLAALIQHLTDDHRSLDQDWQALDQQLHRLQHGHPDLAALHAAQATFCAHYQQHIEQEEQRILSAARERLESHQLQQLGRAMAKRRGIAAGASNQ